MFSDPYVQLITAPCIEADNAPPTHTNKSWNTYREILFPFDAFEGLKYVDCQLTYLLKHKEKQTHAVNHSQMQKYHLAVN